MTDEQEKRTAAMMKEFAGHEDITIQHIASCVYAFGSELACLRIFAKYNTNGATPNPNARVGYSENLTTWYFSLENVDLTP